MSLEIKVSRVLSTDSGNLL